MSGWVIYFKALMAFKVYTILPLATLIGNFGYGKIDLSALTQLSAVAVRCQR